MDEKGSHKNKFMKGIFFFFKLTAPFRLTADPALSVYFGARLYKTGSSNRIQMIASYFLYALLFGSH